MQRPIMAIETMRRSRRTVLALLAGSAGAALVDSAGWAGQPGPAALLFTPEQFGARGDGTSDDYGAFGLSDAQWTRLEAAFPEGVCDYSKPGVGFTETVPWLTYQRADGSVIYGGTPMGEAPRSAPFGGAADE